MRMGEVLEVRLRTLSVRRREQCFTILDVRITQRLLGILETSAAFKVRLESILNQLLGFPNLSKSSFGVGGSGLRPYESADPRSGVRGCQKRTGVKEQHILRTF